MSAKEDRTAWEHAFAAAFGADDSAAPRNAQCPDCGSPMALMHSSGEAPGYLGPDLLRLRCDGCGLGVEVRVDYWLEGRVMGMIRGMQFVWSG